MPAPEREDYDTLIRRLETRIDKLERAQRVPTIFLPNTTTPDDPTAGGLFYVQAGALHYIGGSGTDTTIGPA